MADIPIIVDVDWVKDRILEVVFSDGFQGYVDLKDWFSSPPYDSNDYFTRFALRADGSLDWEEHHFTSECLRKIAD